jgi:hypothetical protein
MLQSGSPCIDAGVDLAKSFGIKSGETDFFGNKLSPTKKFDIGAHEFSFGIK